MHYAGPKPTEKPEIHQMQYWLKAKQRYIKKMDTSKNIIVTGGGGYIGEAHYPQSHI